MKRLFNAIVLHMATEGNGGNGGETPKPAPTSEKLTELQTKKTDAQTALKNMEVGSEEFENQMLLVYGIKKEIDAELANIKRAEQEAQLAEKRAERVKLFDDAIAAYDANLAIQADKKASIEDKNRVYDAYKTARETVVNQLLGGLAVRSTSNTTTTSTDKPAGQKGATGKRIIEKFLANRAAGMNDTDNVKAIITSGESRGTTGAVVLAWQRENGEK